jgi:hypothetical protein
MNIYKWIVQVIFNLWRFKIVINAKKDVLCASLYYLKVVLLTNNVINVKKITICLRIVEGVFLLIIMVKVVNN